MLTHHNFFLIHLLWEVELRRAQKNLNSIFQYYQAKKETAFLQVA